MCFRLALHPSTDVANLKFLRPLRGQYGSLWHPLASSGSLGSRIFFPFGQGTHAWSSNVMLFLPRYFLSLSISHPYSFRGSPDIFGATLWNRNASSFRRKEMQLHLLVIQIYLIKAEVHYLRDECSMLHFKGGLIPVFLCDPNIVVASSNVELGKECLIPQVF